MINGPMFEAKIARLRVKIEIRDKKNFTVHQLIDGKVLCYATAAECV